MEGVVEGEGVCTRWGYGGGCRVREWAGDVRGALVGMADT